MLTECDLTLIINLVLAYRIKLCLELRTTFRSLSLNVFFLCRSNQSVVSRDDETKIGIMISNRDSFHSWVFFDACILLKKEFIMYHYNFMICIWTAFIRNLDNKHRNDKNIRTRYSHKKENVIKFQYTQLFPPLATN